VRRRFATLTIALALSALALGPSAAGARPAFLPPVPGTPQGVVASVAGHDVTIRFTGASAAVGRKLAGKEAMVACVRLPAPGLLFAPRTSPSSDRQTVRAAADGTLTATLDVVGDACLVRSGAWRVARVGVTPAGEVWTDELNAGTALFDAAYLGAPGARYTPVATLVARGGGRIVALPGPDASPPPGQVGYWTDGGRHAVFATLSTAGRRLVYEDLDGTVHRSNAIGISNYYPLPESERARRMWASDDRDPGVKGDHGDELSEPRAGVVRGRVVLQFTGADRRVLRALRGHRVTAYCQALPVSSLLGARTPGPPDALRVIRVPRTGNLLRLPPMAARDLCMVLDDGVPIAFVVPTEAARRAIRHTNAERLFDADLGRAIPPGATAYPSAAAIVAGRSSLVALATPDATPLRGVSGVWTDGARRAEIVQVARDGRRLFVADEGDGMLRTNMTSVHVPGIS
jgi:hypothetical protein